MIGLAISTLIAFSSINARVIKNSTNYIELKVSVSFSGYPLEGDGFVIDSAGYPQIPFYYIRIAIPPDKDISDVKIISENSFYKELPPPPPIPRYTKDGLVPIYRRGEIYRKKNKFPETKWEIVGGGIFRHVRYKLIKIFPFTYDFSTNRLIITKNFTVQVFLKERKTPYRVYTGYDPFERLYREIFSNYNPLWKIKTNNTKQADPFENATIWIKIKTIEEGLYKIDGKSLERLGVHLPVSSSGMVMYNMSSDTLKSSLNYAGEVFHKVPVEIFDGGDGSFDPDDSLYFYALGMKRYRFLGDSISYFEHPYSDTNVYWLAIGSSDSSLAMKIVNNFNASVNDTLNALLSTYRHEINMINPAEKGLRWVGEILRMYRDPGVAEYDFNFNLQDLASPVGNGVVVPVILEGASYFDVYVNGTRYVNDVPIYAVHDDTIGLSVFNLKEGENDLKLVLRATGGSDTLNYGNLDYFEFFYQKFLTAGASVEHYFNVDSTGWKILKIRTNSKPLVSKLKGRDVTVFSEPVHSGNYYLLTDSLEGLEEFTIQKTPLVPLDMDVISPMALNLRSQNWNADFLIIGREIFKSTLTNYMNYRSSHLFFPDTSGGSFRSANVVFVPLEKIYEEFGFGVPDPVSIRNFIYYVYHHSSNHPPVYVLFIGDGNYDYKNFAGAASSNLFPPYEPWGLIDINDNFHGALDAFYADVAPDTGFIMEDIFYGRICARNRTELKDYLDKDLVYESAKSSGPWRNRVMLVADDEYNGDTHSHYETVHTVDSDDIYRNYVPHSVEVMEHYLINYPFANDMTKPEARRDFKRKYNLGHLIINIFMHGNPKVLAHERMFVAPEDYPDINAGFRNSFMIIASCKVGAYDRITPAHVIAEEFSLKRTGSIAVLSSTNSTYSSANAYYVKQMFRALKNYQKYSLGELSTFGKNDSHYVLLGDPSIPIGYSPLNSSIYLGFRANGHQTDTLYSARRYEYSLRGLYSSTRYFLRIFESKKETTYVRNWGTDIVTINYTKAPRPFFSGTVFPGQSDSLSGTFTVPAALTSGQQGFAYVYRFGEVGLKDSIHIIISGGIPPGNRGPEIKLFVNGKELQDSASVPQSFLLQIYLSDSDGINLTNSISNQMNSGIEMIVNNDSRNSIDLTPYFNYRENSSTEGYVVYPLTLTNPGLNLLKIIAYDNFKSPSTKTYFIFVQTSETFDVRDFYIYPNPIRDRNGTYITFTLTSPAKVDINIYTIAGTPIWKSGEMMLSRGFHKIRWNGRDLDGDYPANGLYFLTLNVEGLNGVKIKKIEKILIAR